MDLEGLDGRIINRGVQQEVGDGGFNATANIGQNGAILRPSI